MTGLRRGLAAIPHHLDERGPKMSWGNKPWQGGAAPALDAERRRDARVAIPRRIPVPASRFPLEIDLIGGALRARVHLHDVATRAGSVPCWSYVSDGLRAFGQREIACTLRRSPRDAAAAFPEEPLALLVALYRMALRGQRVGPGEHSEVVGGRMFGRHVLYVDALPLTGVALPDRCLAALLITSDELDAARRFGCARVLGRLGHAAHHFPYPPWSERARASVASADGSSLLAQLGVRLIGDIVASAHRGRVTVAISRRWHRTCREALARLPDVPLALLARPDPSADACLVWAPGARDPTAIGRSPAANARVSGACVIAVGGQPADGASLFEDGFALELTASSWAALRDALRTGSPLSIDPGGDPRGDRGAGSGADAMGFALVWTGEP